MKTQLTKPARSKARYTEEYKKEALELWRASGRSAAKVAAELGIRPPLLYRWAPVGARVQVIQERGQAWTQHRRTGSGDPPLACRERQTFRAARSVKKIAGHPLRSAAERYARIQQMSGQYKVAWLCEALLVSRSGYYDWIKRARHPGPRQLENTRLRQRIREEFMRSRQTYGSPRLAHVLGCPGRRNRIARLMRLERLFARQRSKYRVATTDSRHGGPIAPNRVQALVVRRSNQVWATDATCVLTGQGWLYLVAVLDVFSRRVIGWAMNQLLDAPLVITALRMALNQRRYSQNLIVHSDRGAQFALCRLPSTARPTWPKRLDESKRQLLRQRFYRVLL